MEAYKQSIKIAIKNDFHAFLYTLQKLLRKKLSTILLDTIYPSHTKMVMTMSFDIDFNKHEMPEQLLKSSYSSFDTSIYPGVHIKYYYNYLNKKQCVTCVCKCDECNDATCGYCKKTTIAAFKSGSSLLQVDNAWIYSYCIYIKLIYSSH